MTRLGVLHGGASYHLNTLADPVVAEHVTDRLYLPDLAGPAARAVMAELDTLLVFDRLHPDLLRSHAPALLDLPGRGGTLAVLGEVEAHTWLPGLHWEPRPTNFWWWRTGEDPGIHARTPEHPIWRFLARDDVVWHYHGLLRPPTGVIPLATVNGGGVILYEDRASTAGRLIVTTMDPVHHHGSNFMPAATRLLHGLVRWLAQGSGMSAGGASGA